jgi:hypothetical protein
MMGAVRKKRAKARNGALQRLTGIGLAMAAWTMIPGIASANSDVLSQAFGGGPDALAGIERVDDAELDTMRGGDLTSIAFGLFMYVDINNFDDPTTVESPDGLDISTTEGGEIQVFMGLGAVGNANGVIQFTNINGSGNTVNNNLILNVIVAQSGTDIQDSLSTLPTLNLGG